MHETRRVQMFGTIFYISLASLGHYCNAYTNLYMDKREANRLIGINNDVYYVRDGQINTYASSFNVPVKPHLDYTIFMWHSLQPPTIGHVVQYSIGFIYLSESDISIMRIPQLNITKDGTIPSRLSAFKVYLSCTGHVSGNVDFIMQINMTIASPTNITTVDIKRRKTCDKAERPEVDAVTMETVGVVQQQASTTATSFYMAMGGVCGFILLLALLITACFMRSQKTRQAPRYLSVEKGIVTAHQTNNNSAVGTSTSVIQHQQQHHRPPTPSGSVFTGISHRTSAPQHYEHDTGVALKKIWISRGRVTLGDILMEGVYGKVYHGLLLMENKEGKPCQSDVLVKTLTGIMLPGQAEELVRDACALADVRHPNIGAVMAACRGADNCPLLVYPYMDKLNLKLFLQNYRAPSQHMNQSLQTQQLLYIAIQIANGVQYLHKQNIVHRDIAARNCLVNSALTVKLGDCGLSRDLFPSDYYCLEGVDSRPVKWLALETLIHRLYSTSSDVWAYGVTLWEVMSHGYQPYMDVDPTEMVSYLQQGYRAAKPPRCPDDVFSLMACCWAAYPEERPHIDHLLNCMHSVYSNVRNFV